MFKFMEDLTNFINEKQENGHDIIISMDSNSNLTNTSSNVCKLMTKCHLSDPYATLEPDDQNTPTYKRGTKRIDLFLISCNIRKSIKQIQYLPYDHITISDHKAMFIDLDMETLFLGCIDDTMSEENRIINLKSPKKIKSYEEIILHEFKHHKIEEKLNK